MHFFEKKLVKRKLVNAKFLNRQQKEFFFFKLEICIYKKPDSRGCQADDVAYLMLRLAVERTIG